MSVGPKASHKRLPSLKSGAAIQVVKDENLDPDSYAQQIVRETKLPAMGRYTQRMANEVATPFFGTTRYARRRGRTLDLYDPESGQYLPPLTWKSARTAGHLAVAMAQHALNQRKAKR